MQKLTVVLPAFSATTISTKRVRRTMARFSPEGGRAGRRVSLDAVKGVMSKKLPTTRSAAVLKFIGA